MLEGATLAATALDGAMLDGAVLEGAVLERAVLDGADDTTAAELAGTWISELWLELDASSTGTPASVRVSRKCAKACCTDTIVVVVEPELAIRLVTAGDAAN